MSFDDPDDYRPDSELALVIDPAQTADPGPPLEFDIRGVLEGDPEKAVRLVGKEAFEL